MAPPNYSPFTYPSTAREIPSKSDPNALCKTLIIILLVLAIPLFPSQAPDFITQTVFTDFWEIIHLLFIGLAVSYGLFGRRSAQIAPEKPADSRTDDSRTYLSGISHLTSIFDDGYENVCYENDLLQNNYVNCGDQFVGGDECVVPSGAKIRSLVPNDENEGNGNRAWRSRYLKGESLVVVSNAKCFLGGSSDFKPLNLPIRSLRSRDMDNNNDNDNDKQEFKKRDEFGSTKFEAKGDDGDDAKVVVKIRGVVPVNLDKKFEEVAGRSTIPWRSRSGRTEDEEETSGISKLPAHSRPHSVGEFEFEHLKSRTLRGSMFSSTPELKSSKVGNLERERAFGASHSKATSTDSDQFSNSASSDMDSVGDSESNLENSGVEEEVRKGKQAIEPFDTDAKSSSLSKVLARAKSVRTIKPKRYAVNQKEQCSSRGDGKFGRRFIKSEADSLIQRREEEPGIPPVDPQNQESGRIFSMPKPKPTLPEFHSEEPKPTLPEFHSEEKQDIDDLSSTKSVDTEVGFEKSLVEDDARPNVDTDGELGSEVDRKADEFIAKFREQIRRQKASTSSVEGGHSGW